MYKKYKNNCKNMLIYISIVKNYKKLYVIK